MGEVSILMKHGKIPTGTYVWTSNLVNSGDAWRIKGVRSASGRDVDGNNPYYCIKGDLTTL